MRTAYQALTALLLVAALAAVIAAVWFPELWRRWLLTALFLLLGGATAANSADVARRGGDS